MHTTLIIMAAGLGTRFGEGIKQLAPVGPGGECIMEYSVYDAIEAGFDKIVFIIRKEIEAVSGNGSAGAWKRQGKSWALRSFMFIRKRTCFRGELRFQRGERSPGERLRLSFAARAW